MAKHRTIDLDYILKFVYYDSTSPSGFRRAVEWRSGKNLKTLRGRVGDVRGGINSAGYWKLEINGVYYLCHRIIAKIHGILVDNLQIDHINGDRADNRLCNLRCVENKVNSRNRYRSVNNSSGCIGVSKNTRTQRGKLRIIWCAQWTTADGRNGSKSFSIAKHGEEAAFEMAKAYREQMIQKLNAEGAKYSERHGESI